MVSVHSWCNGSSDLFFMVNPLSYFPFQPVFHDWCNKGYGMCYPVHIKDPLLLIRKNCPCSNVVAVVGFLLLYEWSFTIYANCNIISPYYNVLSSLLKKPISFLASFFLFSFISLCLLFCLPCYRINHTN